MDVTFNLPKYNIRLGMFEKTSCFQTHSLEEPTSPKSGKEKGNKMVS